MKGQTTVKINGDEIPLKFTLGVSEDLQAYAEKEGLDNAEESPKGNRIMFALLELYATEDEWDCDNILDKAEDRCRKYKALGLDQMQNITDMVNEATDDLDVEVGNAKKAKGKK